MQYRTLADLSSLIRKNIDKVPHDIDLVVGIPRSGLLPANMIALYLNKYMTDIDSFIEGRIYSAGERGQFIREIGIKKVLIVDDSVGGGHAMTLAKSKLTTIAEKYELIYLVPIVSSFGKSMVDIYFEVIDDDRIFEWNLFHHGMLGNACLDIDGVLNVDPECDDDGPIYSNFITTAKPLFVPTIKVGALVSCRLEKYRGLTEQWLSEHNIQYNHLEMLDFPTKDSRIAWGKHGEYKGEYYRNHPEYWLFIESSKEQAETIARISCKPVICVETNKLLQYQQKKSLYKRLKRKIHRVLNKIIGK